MAKEIKFGAEARAALERGVNQLADSYIRTERKKRCTGKTIRRSADHKRRCYDRKRNRTGRRI